MLSLILWTSSSWWLKERNSVERAYRGMSVMPSTGTHKTKNATKTNNPKSTQHNEPKKRTMATLTVSSAYEVNDVYSI